MKPNKYETNVKPFLDKVTEWAHSMTEKQIAKMLGISYNSLIIYKGKYPELQTAILIGRRELVHEMKSLLVKKARGYHYVEKKTVTTRVNWPDELYGQLLNAGFSAADLDMAETVKTEEFLKWSGPDTGAIHLLLKNYDTTGGAWGEGWSDDPQRLKLQKEELKLKKDKAWD